MKPDIENIRSKVQVTLDELIREHLIPFKLTAYAISADGPGNYVVPFYDSRIHSFRFSWTGEGSSLKEVVRAAVLGRVRAMDGPAIGWEQLLSSRKQVHDSATMLCEKLELQTHQTNLDGIADQAGDIVNTYAIH